MTYAEAVSDALLSTVRDVIPIMVIILGFQSLVLRRGLPQWPRLLIGFACVILGLSLFLVGLEVALFPLGTTMAQQLADPAFVLPERLESGEGIDGSVRVVPWYRYYWTYLFAWTIGFSATIAEPALLAVAIKAHEVSGGTIQVWGLRVAVAIGCGLGVMLGALRIVLGWPLPMVILGGYLFVIVQTLVAPKMIVPLAYDSGGVTTSTITVPIIAALGLGLATQIPGRDPLVDGFGMIALAVLFPMTTVMGYAQLAIWWNRRQARVKARRMDRFRSTATAP
jgi:hypothetical protein